MTHELIPADDTPRHVRPQMMATGRPVAIIPQSMDDAYRLGKAICLAGMAPKGMDTPEKCMIAIMRGMEVGLTPMQALDKIAIVNGRPTIWGDGALGLVRGSGLCEYVKEWIEGEGDTMVAVCEAKRRGEADPVRRSFSVREAKEASLWGKAGPWQQFKRRMLAMRARAFCLRDLFADVLGGLYLKEELDNGDATPEPRRIAPSAAAPMIEARPTEPAQVAEHQPQPASADQVDHAPRPARQAPSAGQGAQQPQDQPKPAAQPQKASAPHYDPEKVRKAFDDAGKAATDRDALNEAFETIVGPWYDDLPNGHPDRTEIDQLYRIHAARVDGEEGVGP